ncbi:MAG TPA: hypothetical protein ENH50_09640 [Nitrospirae bacterium]|nr:hypothetical protein [Nitrospirota bacterium]
MVFYKALLAFLTSLLITLYLLPHLARIALKIGLMDYPGMRKVHRRPKPLVGGIAMMMAFSLSSLLFAPLTSLRGLFAGMLTLSMVGFLDDFRELNHKWKFVFQILASIFMIYLSGTMLTSFGDLLGFGPINFGSAAYLLTVFCTIGVINAINMIDGVDGLAGGVSFVALLSFSLLAYLNNQPGLVLISLSLAGAVVAFMRYNWHPSRLFMGDAGSLALGFVLAYLSIALTQNRGTSVQPVVPLLILSVPVVDTVTVMTKRAIKGKNPFHPDRYHLHHILLRSGLKKTNAVKVIIIMSALMSGIGIAGTILDLPGYYLFYIFAVYFLVYFTSSFFIKDTIRFGLRFQRNRCVADKKTGRAIIGIIQVLDLIRLFRKTRRYSADLTFSCARQSNESVLTGTISNISRNGFSALLETLVFRNEELDVTIKLPVGGNVIPFRATAKVMWLSHRNNGYHRYGFKFTKIEREDRDSLRHFLKGLRSSSIKIPSAVENKTAFPE